MAISLMKYIGGKTRQIRELEPFFPSEIRNYYEPFVGAGSVYLNLARPRIKGETHLSDLNPFLCDVYEGIRSDYDRVKVHALKHVQEKAYFYAVRERVPEDLHERAAWFLWLTASAYNGIVRYRDGRCMSVFGFPGGHPSAGKIRWHNVELVSRVMPEVRCCDFSTALQGDFDCQDLIYCDPPYVSSEEKNYYSGTFPHEGLADRLREIAKTGCKIIVSNSLEAASIYEDFEIHEVKSHQRFGKKNPKKEMIACKNIKYSTTGTLPFIR